MCLFVFQQWGNLRCQDSQSVACVEASPSHQQGQGAKGQSFLSIKTLTLMCIKIVCLKIKNKISLIKMYVRKKWYEKIYPKKLSETLDNCAKFIILVKKEGVRKHDLTSSALWFSFLYFSTLQRFDFLFYISALWFSLLYFSTWSSVWLWRWRPSRTSCWSCSCYSSCSLSSASSSSRGRSTPALTALNSRSMSASMYLGWALKSGLTFIKQLGAVSLTYLSILKEGFTPIFIATLSYGKKAFHHKKTGVTFPISLGKRRPSITFHIA